MIGTGKVKVRSEKGKVRKIGTDNEMLPLHNGAHGVIALPDRAFEGDGVASDLKLHRHPSSIVSTFAALPSISTIPFPAFLV